MTSDQSRREERHESRLGVQSVRLVLVGLLVLGTVLAGITALSGAAVAQETATATATPSQSVTEKAPYYDEPISVANESWLEGRENATLPNVLNMASRFGSFIVGDDVAGQGDVGSAGPLLVGAVIVGMLIGAVAGAGVGFVGGGVLTVVAVALVTTTNTAPQWLWGVMLFAIGVVLASVIKGTLR